MPPEIDGDVSRSARNRLNRAQRGVEERRRGRLRGLKRSFRVALVVVLLGAPLGGGIAWIATRRVLPPTTIANHTESLPAGHILTEPMPIEVQKHMLEHADGGGRPGVIIRYNCEDFACPPDLADQLTGVALDYPSFVYLAPNPNMDAKIALTRQGEILVLDRFAPGEIRQFILAR